MTDTRPSLSSVLAAATSNTSRAISLLEMKAMTQSFVTALAQLRFSNSLPVGQDIILRDGIEKLVTAWENARVERVVGPTTYNPLAEFETVNLRNISKAEAP